MDQTAGLDNPSRSRNRLRQRLALAACWLLASACAAGGPGPAPTRDASPDVRSPSATATPAAATADPLAARTDAEIAVPGGPDLPVEAFGSLWVLTPDSDNPGVTRLDPQTNEIIATLPVGSHLCQAIGATEDAIWICAKSGVVRVDPQTNEATAQVDFPIARTFGYLPIGDGALWALGGQASVADQLVRIDPQANRVVDTYALGFDAEYLSYGEQALWLSDTKGGRLWRFDPATEALTEHAAGLPDPGPSAVGAGSIWLAVNAGEMQENQPSATDVTLVRIDPITGAVAAEIATGGTIFGGLIYASDEAIWVRAPEPFLALIDPATNQVVETLRAKLADGSVAVAFDSLWVTSSGFNKVIRLRP